jgi:hypothetical protein
MNGTIWQTRTATANPSCGPGTPRAGASTIDNPALTAMLFSCHFTCQRKPGSSAGLITSPVIESCCASADESIRHGPHVGLRLTPLGEAPFEKRCGSRDQADPAPQPC